MDRCYYKSNCSLKPSYLVNQTNNLFAHRYLGKDAVINKIPEQSGVENMTYGLAVNIILKDYSTFYRYDLQSIIGENRTSLLDILPSGILRLKDEIEGNNAKYLQNRSFFQEIKCKNFCSYFLF